MMFVSSLFSNEKDRLLETLRHQTRDTNYISTLFVLAGEYATSNTDSTVWYANEILRISDSLGYKNGIGRSYFMTGLAFYVRGVEDSAMIWFQKTLSVFNETRDPEGLGLAFHNIGRLYVRRGEYAKAKEYIRNALELRKKHSSPGAVLSSISMLGLIAGEEHHLQEEEAYYVEALNIAKGIKPFSHSGIAMATTNLAWVEQKRKNYEKAIGYFQQSLQLYKEMRDVNGTTEVLIGLAQIALDQKEFSKVIPYAEQALRYSRNMINPDGVLQSANLLSLAYEQMGDYKNALRYHKLHTAQQDSLNRLRVKKEYVDALSRFETEQKEAKITILEQENQLQYLERNIVVGILIVVLLGVGAVYIRSKEIRNIEVARHAETLQRNFSEQLLAQQEQERKRISTELHDSLGQNLLIIKNMLDISIQTKMPKHALNQQLGELSEIASRSIEETRAIASNLHPYQLNRMGLTKALIAMMRNLEQSTKISLFHSIDKAEGIFSKDTEAHLYRIVQESVNNVLKHSNATELRVELRNNGQHIRISISDNGNGFDASSVEQKESLVGGLGLFGLKERARIIGGRLSIHSAIGSGTTVEVVVPV